MGTKKESAGRKKLKLNKETMKDLAVRAQAGALKGGKSNGCDPETEGCTDGCTYTQWYCPKF